MTWASGLDAQSLFQRREALPPNTRGLLRSLARAKRWLRMHPALLEPFSIAKRRDFSKELEQNCFGHPQSCGPLRFRFPSLALIEVKAELNPTPHPQSTIVSTRQGSQTPQSTASREKARIARSDALAHTSDRGLETRSRLDLAFGPKPAPGPRVIHALRKALALVRFQFGSRSPLKGSANRPADHSSCSTTSRRGSGNATALSRAPEHLWVIKPDETQP